MKKMIALTYYQLIFYYEWLYNPTRSDYNLVVDNTVSGNLDYQKFDDSLVKIMNEHFITRHTISNQSNGMFWLPRDPILNIVNYHDAPLSDQQIYNIVSAPFDLEKELLARVDVIKLDTNRYRIISVFHHIVIDGISSQEIWEKCYKNYNGIEYTVSPLQEQIQRHQELCNGFEQIVNRQKPKMQQFWQTHLNGIKGINLDFLKIQQPLLTSDMSTITESLFSYDESVYQQVKSLRRRYKITTYIFGQLVMAVLLHKISEQKNITIAYPIAILEGKELLFGAHVNTMIINYRFDDQTTLKSLIDQTLLFYKTLKLSGAKYLPVNDIVSFADDSGVLDIVFAQTFFRDHSLGLNGVKDEATNHEFHIDLASKLLFEQEEHDNQINYRVRYDHGILDSTLVQQFITLYQGLFAQILNYLVNDQADIWVKSIDLITHECYMRTIEAQQLIAVAESLPQNIVLQFESIVTRYPERTALIYQDKRFTYQQLNEQVNRLAHYFKTQLSCQPDDLIALYLDKSEHMLITILAILKVGAAYVPIDPKIPQQRLQFILHDTHAVALVTHAHYIELFNELALFTTETVIAIDRAAFNETLNREYSTANPNIQIQPNQLAYVIYTSGTTGIPKGVMLEHRGLINLAVTKGKLYGLAEQTSSVAQCGLWYSSYVFDAHVSEVFTLLANGHTLHILAEEKRLNFQALATYITEHRISIATIPPALLDKEQLLTLSILIVAGEVCNAEIMDRYWAQNTVVINAYGPTESTVCATLHHYTAGDNHRNIGHSLPYVQTYILDSDLKPVPPGVIGELYIGGFSLARGYLNNPEQTAQVFISNPFQTAAQKRDNENSRFYKTGDLVRLLNNGEIEYIGRKDFQVKIRGIRIELGEIEARLNSHPQIKQSIVLALDHSNGTQYLVAYYATEHALTTDELLDYLQQYLPDYMLPAILVPLLSLPLNINGKVDRHALPTPDFTLNENYKAPETEIEQQLTEIYAELLAIPAERISIAESFFKLGGNSILAIKLSAKITAQLKKTVSITAIFNYKTIRALASIIEQDNQPQQVISAPIITDPEQQLLSFAQERLWFIDCYEGGSHAYNIPLVFKIRDTTDVLLLKEAIQTTVERHEVLRSVIKTNAAGVGYQQVIDLQTQPLVIQYIHCEHQAELDKLIDQHIHRVFKLDEEYPISIHHYGVDQQHYMSLVIHHIAFDGWSIDLLINELNHHYRYLTALQTSNVEQTQQRQLIPITMQYKDFALWQRHYLQGDVLKTQLQYWQQQLVDCEPLSLPTDYTRPTHIDYSGRDIAFTLDADLSRQLRSLATELNVSLYSLLLSGYYLMLGAFSNQKDIIIGSPIAGRHYPSIENTMGFFVNTLVLRQQIDPQQTLTDFIQQIGQSVTEAQQYQDLPFEKLVDALQIESDTSRHPLFQVMFGVQSFGHSTSQHIDDLIELYQENSTYYQVAKFDLSTMLDDSQACITGSFNYATALFNEETIQQYIRVYRQILSQFNALQQENLVQLQYLDSESYETVIQQWNQTQRDYPQQHTLSALFEAQVQRTPDHIAFVYEDVRLCYRELNERSNRLAHHLRAELAIQPDDLIALCLERSEQMLIAMLAVLKSGAAYVPMDPQVPDDRLRFMLADTQAKAVITTAATTTKIEPLLPEGQILLDLDQQLTKTAIQACSANCLTPLAQANNLAYVIYTSGTTGNPKGVMLEHRSVINLVYNIIAKKGLIQLDATMEATNNLWLNNYIFDVHVLDVYPTLMSGHSLYMPLDAVRYDSELLNDYVTAHKINTAAIPPTLLRSNGVIDANFIALGGDVTNIDAMALHVEQGIKIINFYGPTENAVCTTGHFFQLGDSNTNIGRPLGNNRIYILDAQLRPVPIGGIGELYVGGDGLARGYLHNDLLTRASFIANPFQSSADQQQGKNSRIYKTGDLVKYKANGEIDYLGRNDFQVKIRGFRVELGEIEAHLSHYPAITNAVVLVQENSVGSQYLVAYYVCDRALSENALRDYLHGFLPDYMMPAAFMHLRTLPMTLNGKLDRHALPKPTFTHTQTYIAPSNEAENIFCTLFADVLGLNRDAISIDDDFFKLGGDSISSIQLANRIRQTLHQHLAIKDVFTHRTPRALSQCVLHMQTDAKPIIQSEPGILEGELPLLPVQQWFFHQVKHKKLPVVSYWNQAFLLKVPVLDCELLRLSISKLVEHHDVLRVNYPDASMGYYQTGIPVLPFTVANVQGLTITQREDLLTEWQSHFDVQHGSLFHIGYLEGYDDGSARIHIAVHHLNIDAVSWRIISHDLHTLYQFFADQGDYLDRSTPTEQILGHKGTSYRQWVQALQNYPVSTLKEDMDESTYWHNQVTDCAAYNESLNVHRVDTLHKTEIHLSEKNTRLLLREVHTVYGTDINDILLTALSVALQQILASDHHYVLLEGHGREDLFADLDINNTVGWFTCMYPVKLCVDPQGLIQTVPVIKDRLREIPHHGIGYSALMGYTEQVLPAISVNYLGQFDDDNHAISWSFSRESAGVVSSPDNHITDFLSLNGAVLNGQLHFMLEGYLAQTPLKQLAAVFRLQLEKLVSGLSQIPRSYLTATDIEGLVSNTLLNRLQDNQEVEAVYLANSLQQGFIYHAISQGEFDQAYRTQISWDYHNPLQIDYLQQAWQLSQAKHPTLRLRFSWAEELVQLIDKKGQLNWWRYTDISALSELEQTHFYTALIEQEQQIPYDLAQDNLFRVYLIKCADDLYRCIFSNHHAILDGWSLPVLLTDVHQHYLSLLAGQSVDLIEDQSYLRAQAYLQTHGQATSEFWQHYLGLLETQENLDALLKPTQRHVTLSDYRYIENPQELMMTVEADDYEHLKVLCTEHGFTLNALFQYCWHQQLSLYGNTTTTIVGMTVSGRNLPIDGIESSVGLFINTLPVILEHRDDRVINIIKELQTHINNVNSHSNINLVELQTAGTRLFNSLFVFENYPISQSDDQQQLRLSFHEAQEKLDYPLGVVAFEKVGAAVFKIKYAAELFSQQTIERLLQGVQLTLKQLVNNPAIYNHELPLLTDNEYTQLVERATRCSLPFAQDKLLSQLFEEQVSRTPDQTALIYEGKKLTYQQLNEQANQMATYLQAHYVIKPDDLIGLYLDKSERLIISLLAILKAGAAYVPMSPQAPNERIQFMVSETQPQVMLTNQHYYDELVDVLAEYPIDILCVDSPSLTQQLTHYDGQNVHTQTRAHHLAYIIYTSGTTGQPKGVMIEHRTLANLTTAQQNIGELFTCYESKDQKKVLWYSNYVFDAHVYDIYNTLVNGHCLHVLDERKRFDFDALADYIKHHHIDCALMPPALLDKHEPLAFSTLIVGGEVTNAEVIDRYRQAGIPVINVYGPTETTVLATSRVIQDGDSNTNIGYPLNNVCLYILDHYLRPVPVGVIGELYIGGAGVGRGYLNNLKLTQQVFIPNPFQSSEDKAHAYNDRLYKSGDLVRYLADGSIDYIGRNDFQVKIRGFRIELGEIEARLMSYPQINQAVVLAFDHQVSKYLAAYYVAEYPLPTEELMTHLHHNLPDYMVPSVFIWLATLPLTINGKIDRQALPTPSLTTQKQYVSPVTATEQQLTVFYAELLNIAVESASVEDDFFALGGNSILAIKLSNKIGQQWQKNIPITDILAHKTIRALAQWIDQDVSQQLVISAQPVSDPQQQLLSFAQERLWFIDCYENGTNAYNMPLVFKLQESTDPILLEKAIQSIIARHEVLHSVIKANREGVGYQQVIDLQSQPFVISHSTHVNEQTMNAAISQHLQRIFVLDQEYPVSVNHYLLGSHHYMSVVIHHIAFDGWSIDLLMKELYHHYRYFEALQANHVEQANRYQLMEIDIQYKDFALWQRQYLQGEILNNQLQYWQQYLSDFEPLNLPIDYRRPMQLDYAGDDVVFTLGSELSQQLRGLATELNVSLYSLLLSGYYLMLSSISHQKDIVIGTPIAGRHYQGIENSMGFFVNTLVLRQQIDSQQRLNDFVQEVGQAVNNAQKYQDLPFEKLVDALQVKIDTSRHPIFQTMFGVQSFGNSTAQDIEQLLERYQSDSVVYQAAKFDITTMLDDSADEITGCFNYATRLFKPQTIQQYIEVYQHILSQFVARQQQPLAQMQYLNQATYHKVINEWNQTACAYPQDVTLHELFEAQVQRTPNNIAIVYENVPLSYRELNERANQLASYLRAEFTLQPDDLIALCLERSELMLIAILAILKAGAAYVPIDPYVPDDRIQFMLGDTQAKVIIATAGTAEKIRGLAALDQVTLDLNEHLTQSTIATHDTKNLVSLAKPKHLAYVIYTSGTTGNPKGVMLEHQGVVNRIIWMQNQYPITEHDHILQKTNYTFDVSVWELFWANWYGACIVFADSELYKDNVYLSALIAQAQISVLHFVPSMLIAFIETVEAQPELLPQLNSLRYLFCSGEALNLYEVQKCQQLIPHCEIHNLYGPTEASIDVLYYDCNGSDITKVLIGKPIANTSAYILNEQRQPVPIGGIGELYIGGDGVARGYLNNINLSNERFIPNPFQTVQEQQRHYNQHIYRTGDVVRYLADGNIEYLGRNDFQVKIRGFRVELGEVEARLVNYPMIKHTVVIAYDNLGGDKYLVGYYVADEALEASLLTNYLLETLPEYMVPSGFVHLSVLPTTSNGKLDRKALPKPNLTETVVYIAPENSIEVTLCHLYADILNLPVAQISMEDNFFKLGGNSILAMRLTTKINSALHITLRLIDILNTRTLRELAIKAVDQETEFHPIVEFTPSTHHKPQLFMIHPGIAGCEVYTSLAKRLNSHYHCYGVDSYNFYHEQKIEDLDELSQYYLEYIDQTRHKTESVTLLGWSLGGQIAMNIAIKLEAQGIKNINLYLLDTWLLNKGDIPLNIPQSDLFDMMEQLNIPSHLRATVESTVCVDNKLMTQPLSGKLKWSNVVLFKAVAERETEVQRKYKLNNIGSYLESSTQLHHIQIEASHYKILEKEQEITEHIVKIAQGS